MENIPILELIDITKKFNEENSNITTVIEEFSFKFFKKQSVALVGQSGCGKTTLLQICGLLDCPTSGELLINTISTKKLNDDEKTSLRKNNIGFVYQMHHLFPEFTVFENVALPLMVQKEKNYKDKIINALLNLGLNDKINSFPSELSGGEKQRVAIARAIITNPSIILADEPTGNLDENNAKNVINILLNYIKDNDSSLLLVSHNIDLVKNFDKIITIRNHKLEILK